MAYSRRPMTAVTAMSHEGLLTELRRREGDPSAPRPHVLLVHERDVPTDDPETVSAIERSRIPLPTMYHLRFDDILSPETDGTFLHIADAMSMARWVHGLRGDPGREVIVACSSGTGRSTAICAALLNCGVVAGTQDIMYESGYDPNRMAYETVCAACSRVLLREMPAVASIDYFFPEG